MAQESGRTEQSGYQFKKYRTPACKNCPVNHLCTSRTAGREIDGASMRKALKKITNAIRKTRNYTERDKR
jgi:adenine-specific DNA glycosylase